VARAQQVLHLVAHRAALVGAHPDSAVTLSPSAEQHTGSPRSSSRP
jgi:hypothetical protein